MHFCAADRLQSPLHVVRHGVCVHGREEAIVRGHLRGSATAGRALCECEGQAADRDLGVEFVAPRLRMGGSYVGLRRQEPAQPRRPDESRIDETIAYERSRGARKNPRLSRASRRLRKNLSASKTYHYHYHDRGLRLGRSHTPLQRRPVPVSIPRMAPARGAIATSDSQQSRLSSCCRDSSAQASAAAAI